MLHDNETSLSHGSRSLTGENVYFRYRVSYLTLKDDNMIIYLCTDRFGLLKEVRAALLLLSSVLTHPGKHTDA
jgi:hypothetical protein